MEKTSELELEGGSAAISNAELLNCIDRELGYRKRVYPRWVAARKMSQDKANVEIMRMEMVQSQLVLMPSLTAKVEALKDIIRDSEEAMVAGHHAVALGILITADGALERQKTESDMLREQVAQLSISRDEIAQANDDLEDEGTELRVKVRLLEEDVEKLRDRLADPT